MDFDDWMLTKDQTYHPTDDTVVLRRLRGCWNDAQQYGSAVQLTVDPRVISFLDRLQARADNAYCDYIGMCRKDECLGWEAKVEKGVFGDDELKGHKGASEKLGRHRALQEAVNLLHEMLGL